ncbi:uncharacterized protein METZ01_LOCUS217688, partial [marine metagenome]
MLKTSLFKKKIQYLDNILLDIFIWGSK